MLVLGEVRGGLEGECVHDNRADHTRAQVALLAWGDEIFAHREDC